MDDVENPERPQGTTPPVRKPWKRPLVIESDISHDTAIHKLNPGTEHARSGISYGPS